MTTRREQVREAIARHRKRRRHNLFWRPIMVTRAQLDQLEERGYLDPDLRGERASDLRAMFTADGMMAERWALGCAQGQVAGKPSPRR
jgi:hypothetical protein